MNHIAYNNPADDQSQTGNPEIGNAQTIHPQTDLLCLLINGIGKNAIEEDPDQMNRFQELVTAEATQVKQATGVDQMKTAVEAVIELVAHHNNAVKTGHREHADELTKALRMMSDTIGFVGRSSQAAVHQLAVIGKNLEEVTASNDARNLRLKLGACLKMIRDQSASLKTQSDQHLSRLKAFVASTTRGNETALMEESLDSVTGLPSRAFAENLIEERFTRGTDCIVGVVRLNRLSTFITRYGQSAADGVMLTASGQLAQKLPVGTTLCRWSPNSFVAVTEITSSYAEISQQWRRVGNLKMERDIDEHGRSAYVVLTTTAMVEHLRASASKQGLIHDIERFVAQQPSELAA